MSSPRPRLVATATAHPPDYYLQESMPDVLGIEDPRIRGLFRSGHIRGRYLYLPESFEQGRLEETQGELLAKHLRGGLEMGSAAIGRALERAGLRPEQVDYLVVTTTTGFLAPGLSAHLARAMGMRPSTGRLDVVGMGCNAGLNGLKPAASWAALHPGGVAVLACIEVCSAAYVFDYTLRTAVVNSLFGDGAAAVVVRAGEPEPAGPPHLHAEVLDFETYTIFPAIDAMRYDWDERAHKFSFYLDRDIPYVIGEHAEEPVDALLSRWGLKRRHVRHWIVHSGGKKVIDAMMYNLGLTAHDLRHTISVLRDYGNLSSGSFLFSFERLEREGVVRSGDWGVMVTMGPGTTIETALLRW